MHSARLSRHDKQKRPHNKKEKKLIKLIKNDSESDGDESEHELSYYMKDRVKLMKEVLKIIKPKKIRSMAPDCMRGLDNEEINSQLLEELLGISDKRLNYIFTGQNLNEDSSSTDPEAEDEPIDLISLDDISDGDLVIDLDSDKEKNKKHCRRHRAKIKEEHRNKRVKKEKPERHRTSKKPQEPSSNKTSEENLMSVLELLELQARARAIKSQLVLEKQQEREKQKKEIASRVDSEDDNDAVIVESPRNDEIVISSSDSENGRSCNVTHNREEPVDFWCGTRDKNIGEGEKEKENGSDHTQEQQIDIVTEKETPDSCKKNQATVVENSEHQSGTNLSKQSERVDISEIPLPQPDKSILDAGNGNVKKNKDKTTRKHKKRSKPNRSDISEGELGSTEDMQNVDEEMIHQNENHTVVIAVQTEIENKSSLASGSLSETEITVSQTQDTTTQQTKELVDETKSGNDQKVLVDNSALASETNIEELAKDPEKDVEILATDQEQNCETMPKDQQIIEKESVETNHASDEESKKQKSCENESLESDGDHRNENEGIPNSSSPRKSKRLSTRLLVQTSLPTNEEEMCVKKKVVKKKKAKGINVKKTEGEGNNSSDDGERIVLNVEQSELDSVNAD